MIGAAGPESALPDAPEQDEAPDPESGWQAALARFLRRLVTLAGATWVAYRIPLPILEEWLPFRDVLVATVSVLALGKLLFDTLFYDRFWP